MMVVYTGTSDVRGFSAEDFDSAGVESDSLTFEQGVPQEVEDEVAEALISEEGVFGEESFEEYSEPEEPEVPENAVDPVDVPLMGEPSEDDEDPEDSVDAS